MIVAVGIDSIDISRIEQLLKRSQGRFEHRVFTPTETEYCEGRHRPAESFAARFAAKEATLKCLGTGWANGVAFQQIEVTRQASGATTLTLEGAAAARAAALGVRRWHVSLTHTETTATAFVVAEN